MKLRLFLTIFCLPVIAFSQVGINTTTPEAMLHVVGTTVPSTPGSTNILLNEDFESATLGNVSTGAGGSIYQMNSNSGCTAGDGWRISTDNSDSQFPPVCAPCVNQRAIIDFGASTCNQDATLVFGSFTPLTNSIDVSFNYGYDAYRDTDIFNVTLYNTSAPGSSVVLVNITTNANFYDQSFSTTASVNAGDTYEMRVRYRADYSYGVTVDNFLVEETIAPTTGTYTFKLEDGQQQAGYVMTSDANGNATWLPAVGDGVGTDNQSLSISGGDLSISGGNTVTLPGASDDWKLEGNAGTTAGTDFIGTTDSQDLVFKSNNAENLRLTTAGQLEITNSRNNIFLGKDAGENFNYSPSTYGKRNIHIGTESGFSNQVRSDNIGIGYFSLKSNTLGGASIAIGNFALEDATNTDYSLAIGHSALANNLNSVYNVAVGHRTLSLQNSGQRNTALGADAGRTTLSNDSVFVGYAADEENDGGTNVVIGSGAGIDTFGVEASGRVLIGFNAWHNQGGDNKLVIENSSSTTPLIGGDFSSDSVSINKDLTNPANLTHTLNVGGSVKIDTLINIKPGSEPTTPEEGDVYYDSATHKLRVYNGTAWDNLN